MKFKQTIVKKAAPLLEPHGYVLYMPGGVNYIFWNEEEKAQLSFDTSRFVRDRLRIEFKQTTSVDRFESVYLKYEYLRPEFFPYKLNYESQESFDASMELLIQKTIEIIFPHCDRLKDNFVIPTEEMHRELSCNTVERANQFADKWGLAFNDSNDTREKLNALIKNMQSGIENRQRDFDAHREDVLGMAAFVGEVMNKKTHTEGQWYWRGEAPHTYYAVAAQGYDPLMKVAWAWNDGDISIRGGFDRFPF